MRETSIVTTVGHFEANTQCILAGENECCKSGLCEGGVLKMVFTDFGGWWGGDSLGF
jgi:hypothetical protein